MQIYGEHPEFAHQFALLANQMVEAYAARPESLRLLDIERELTPDWFQRETMTGYIYYTDLFASTLAGVRERIDYLRELGITYLHLMPLL